MVVAPNKVRPPIFTMKVVTNSYQQSLIMEMAISRLLQPLLAIDVTANRFLDSILLRGMSVVVAMLSKSIWVRHMREKVYGVGKWKTKVFWVALVRELVSRRPVMLSLV